MKIVVAEDEPKVREFVKMGLEQAGMVVDAVKSLSDLLSALAVAPYDVLVLDRLFDNEDSLKLLPKIRKQQPLLKIIILSALAEPKEKVKGLNEGADDYLGKPFHVAELIARIHSLLRQAERRAQSQQFGIVTYQDLKIELESQRVYRGIKRIELTGKEFRILTLLAHAPGHIYSKASILDQCWDMNHFPESNVVEVTIASLRVKLDKGLPQLIHSRRGVGYWLGEA